LASLGGVFLMVLITYMCSSSISHIFAFFGKFL
jgi:hypothetical protein